MNRSLRLSLAAAAVLALGGAACDSTDGDASGSGGGGAGSASGGGAPGVSSSSGTGGAATGSSTSSGGDGGDDLADWELTWSDEFNETDGSPVDTSKWTSLVGGDGWGNQELEYYTDNVANAHHQGGSLVITATRDGAADQSCWYGACQFTSARLQTKGKFSQTYGRFEARLKVPFGQGLWPAFWMLGDNISDIGWPTCGEIDIMENIGREPGIVHGTLHGPGYSGGNPLTGQQSLADGAKLTDDFHVFTAEWEATAIRFYLDGALYVTQTVNDVPEGKTWVYDHPFFLLLNVAVGGAWPGEPDGSTTFPQTMQVDYVRVYKHR